MKKGTPVEKSWPTQLGPDDYDFTTVPENEEEGCAYYEYARESRRIIAAVEKLRPVENRTEPNDARTRKIKKKVIQSFRASIGREELDNAGISIFVLRQFTQCKAFPGAAYQKLPPEDKIWASEFGERARGVFRHYLWDRHPPLLLFHLKDWSLFNSPAPGGFNIEELKAKHYPTMPT